MSQERGEEGQRGTCQVTCIKVKGLLWLSGYRSSLYILFESGSLAVHCGVCQVIWTTPSRGFSSLYLFCYWDAGVTDVCYHVQFYLGSKDPNPGPHIYVASFKLSPHI